jgi:hypothetical protein
MALCIHAEPAAATLRFLNLALASFDVRRRVPPAFARTLDRAHNKAKPNQVQHLQQRGQAQKQMLARQHPVVDLRISPDRNDDLRVVNQSVEHVARHERNPRDCGQEFGTSRPEFAVLSQMQKQVGGVV